jgi:hypothetical protein
MKKISSKHKKLGFGGGTGNDGISDNTSDNSDNSKSFTNPGTHRSKSAYSQDNTNRSSPLATDPPTYNDRLLSKSTQVDPIISPGRNMFGNGLASSSRRSKSISNSNDNSNFEESLKDPFLIQSPSLKDPLTLAGGLNQRSDQIQILSDKIVNLNLPTSIAELSKKFTHVAIEGYQENSYMDDKSDESSSPKLRY